jgi:hypothetical protein
MDLYHHLKIAGVKKPLFSAQAITAIHQGSGEIFRRATHLVRGALIAAASPISSFGFTSLNFFILFSMIICSV